MVLVFVEGNFQRVEDEADVGFLKSVQRDEFFLELVAKHLFGGVKGGSHSNLEGASANDSGAFKAGVLACWFDHEQSLARDSHVAEIANFYGDREDTLPGETPSPVVWCRRAMEEALSDPQSA